MKAKLKLTEDKIFKQGVTEYSDPYASMGTENHWVHPLFRNSLKFTDGIKRMRDTLQCYWLIDGILMYYKDFKAKLDGFAEVKFTLTEDGGGTLEVRLDSDKPCIFSRHVHQTDLKQNVRLWIEGDVLLLPDEH